MTSIFPIRNDDGEGGGAPRVLRIDDDAADDVVDALGSETARGVLRLVYEDPRPASELAAALDTSIQNVRYHLDNLAGADLVAVTGTWYSETGNEMKVYAPTSDAIVLYEGDLESGPSLRAAVANLVTGVGLLGIIGLLVDRFTSYTRVVGESGAPTGEQTASGTGTQVSTTAPTTTAGANTSPAVEVSRGPFEAVTPALTPGTTFFVGGVIVALSVFAWWYVTRYRPDSAR